MHVHMENISVSRQRRAAMCEIRLRAKFGTHLRIIGFEVGGVGGGGGRGRSIQEWVDGDVSQTF